MQSRYEINFVPERNLFWNYVKAGVMVPRKRYLWDGPLVFLGEGGLGRITFFFFFFPLGDKSHFLFLGADGGEAIGNG